MKKIILLFTVAIALVSCSKSDDDNSEKQLALNYQNMSGTWILSSIILADGSTVAYQGQCSTLNDYFTLNTQTDIKEYHYNNGCTISSGSNFISSGYFFEGNLVKNANGVFSDARITSLTSNTMRIEYDDVDSFGYFSNYTQVKGAVLTK